MSALDHQEGGNHYAKLSIQPIEYIHANGLGFAEGSVIKYVTRWRDKNGIADLKKARHFIDLLIELEEKRGSDTINSALDSIAKKAADRIANSMAGMTAQEAINYADESQYTEADKQAASLDPALVELCSKTTIYK